MPRDKHLFWLNISWKSYTDKKIDTKLLTNQKLFFSFCTETFHLFSELILVIISSLWFSPYITEASSPTKFSLCSSQNINFKFFPKNQLSEKNHCLHVKQESHDGPETAHLYISPGAGPILTLGPLYELGRHSLEDVSC
jgi:hypothetical protein